MYPQIFLGQLINVLSTIIGALLSVRFLFKLFGANPAAWFVDFIYDASAVFLAPFANMFSNISLDGTRVIEINSLIALLFYSLLFALVNSFLFRSDIDTRDRHIHI